MDVVLVNAPAGSLKEGSITSGSYGLTNMPPLGLLYLAASLKANGFSVKFFDCNTRPSSVVEINKISSMIISEHPAVVGISATSRQLRGAVQLATVLKSILGNSVSIILGGAHATADPKFTEFFPEFDICFIGEGELSFPQLVEKVLGGEKVKGEYYGAEPQNLDLLPFPSRELTDKSDYFEPGKEFANISTMRGCPYNCMFCSVPVGKNRRVRFRSPVNVVDEMEEIGKEYEWHFYLVDDLATVSREHMIGICSELARRNLDATWACQTRVDLVDRKLLLLMYEAGCRYISFGVESGSPRIRNRVVGKKFSNEETFKVFNICREIGIATLCSLMIGFPSETLDDIEETVKLAKTIPADAVEISITEIYPGTQIFNEAVNEGIIDAEIYRNAARGSLSPSVYYVPKGLSLKQLVDYRKVHTNSK